jgi:hypothetical protein
MASTSALWPGHDRQHDLRGRIQADRAFLHVDLGHGHRASIERGVDMSALRALRECHLDGDWCLFDGHRKDFPEFAAAVLINVGTVTNGRRWSRAGFERSPPV